MILPIICRVSQTRINTDKLKIKEMKIFRYIYLPVFLISLCACTADDFRDSITAAEPLSVRFSMPNQQNAGGLSSEIDNISAFRFEDDILKEIISNIAINDEGVADMNLASTNGNLYFLANAAGIIEDNNFQADNTSEEDFLSIKSDIDGMSQRGITMTGKASLSGNENNNLTVAIRHSMARIDLESYSVDANVHSVRIKNVASQGYVFEQEERTEDIFDKKDVFKDFGDTPFYNRKEAIFYLPEQYASRFLVEVIITINGAWKRLRAELPEILRNKVYTLKIHGNGADLAVSVYTDDWEYGSGSETEDVNNGIVDIENSVLTDAVFVNAKRDSVFVEAWDNSFTLAIFSEEGADCRIDGNVDKVDMEFISSRSLVTNSRMLKVHSKRKMPGISEQYAYVNIYKNDVLRDRVVIVFKANPVKIEGIVSFDENATCDFARYIDGELAVITIPEGKNISLSFADDSPEWMKLEDEGNNRFCLLAGWKPNDPEADGRTQTAHITISDGENLHDETYTVKRQNWGLPVVNINGIWWCKYNLRGNVKNFTDQILVSNEPAGGSLADYMSSCSDDEFLNLIGDQYQAGNQYGLNLVHNGEGFVYENFNVKSDNFGTLSPTYMAPDGYEIPDYDDFRFFNWGNNSNLGYHNPGVFNNGLGQRLNFKVVERNASFLGNEYGPISFYDFEYGGEHLLLCGLGHQWSETEIAKMYIIFATYGNTSNTWFIEGYSQSSGSGNWFKYSGNNQNKTRTIRCVKTPVEYIYE